MDVQLCPRTTVQSHAALDVLALLPDRWAVGPTSYDPGTRRWSYIARGPRPSRGKAPETIVGTGDDELAAMTDLRIQLDERRKTERLDDIDRRGRAAYLEELRLGHRPSRADR